MAGARKKSNRKSGGAGRIRESAAVYLARSPGVQRERPIKKNVRLHQSLIDEARRILGTGTETETIETALDLVVFRHELLEGVEGMRGRDLVNLFDEKIDWQSTS